MKIDGGLTFSSNIFLRMVEDLQPDKNDKVFFDNWFTSIDLVYELAKKKI